jgi:hypothetical protein
MYRKLADTITLDFTVHSPTTGAVADADSLPTVEVFEDDTDSTLAGATVTKRTGKTGNYRVAVAATIANGFEVGKSYNVVVTVIAGTVTAKAVIGSFAIDGKRVSDLNDIPAGTVMGKSPATLAAADVSGNLPAVVKAQDDIDFGALQKVSLNAATPAGVQNLTQGATKGELDAAQAAIELAVAGIDLTAITDAIATLENVSVAEILAGDLADDQVFAPGSLADRLRKLHWVLCNKLAITDATGAFIAYKDDGLTPGATGSIVDTGVITTRSKPTWP